jgi:hypothetical protein
MHHEALEPLIHRPIPRTADGLPRTGRQRQKKLLGAWTVHESSTLEQGRKGIQEYEQQQFAVNSVVARVKPANPDRERGAM